MTSTHVHRPVEAFIVEPQRSAENAPDTAAENVATAPPICLQASNLEAIVGLGIELHRAGHLRAAEEVYLRVLESQPRHPRVVHLLGVTYHQFGADDQALGYLERAAAGDRTNPDLLRHLGETYRALHRLDEAVRSFERAIELQPDDADSMCNLGHAYLQGGRFGLAESSYQRALAADRDDTEALTGLAVALTHQHRENEAETCYRRVLEIDPGNHEARHMRDALRGERPPAPAPEYVASLFDRYAPSFDRHLVETLRYDVPRLLRSAVDEVNGHATQPLRILDLGCGTGLCGDAFRDVAATLDGVDLSPRMIEKARERGLYDTLVAGDLIEALRPADGEPPASADPARRGRILAPTETHPRWDLVLAADVFVYVGELSRVFAAVAEAIAPGGLFAFSVERADDSYALRSSGRYAHSIAYVRKLAVRNAMAVRHLSEVAVRLEKQRELPGLVFVLEKG